MTALKAIRAKCLDCMCNQVAEVTRCPCQDCPLYPFRMGHNPNKKKRELSEAQKAALDKARNSRKKLTHANETAREDVSEGKYTIGSGSKENIALRAEETRELNFLDIDFPPFGASI